MGKYQVTTDDGSIYEVETDEAPQSEANRALGGTGLSVSQPKPPKVPGLTPRLPNSELPGYREAEAWEKGLRGQPDQSLTDTAGDVAKHLGKTAISPLTGIPGAVGEVYDWAKGGFKPPVMHGNGALGPPSYATGSPLDQATGNAMLSVATIPGTKEAVQQGARNVASKTSNAVRTAANTPGTGRILTGIAEMGGGMGAAATGHPIPGTLAAIRGYADLQKGLAARRAAQVPPAPPAARRVAPPPQTGSSLSRMQPPPKPQHPVPALQGTSIPPSPPPQARAPIPPLQGSNTGPQPIPRRTAPPPAIRGSSLQPTPVADLAETLRTQGATPPAPPGTKVGPQEIARALEEEMRKSGTIPDEPPGGGKIPRASYESENRHLKTDAVDQLLKRHGITWEDAQQHFTHQDWLNVFKEAKQNPPGYYSGNPEISKGQTLIKGGAPINKLKPKLARGGVAVPKAKRKGHWYGKPTAAMKLKNKLPKMPRVEQDGPPPFPQEKS